MIEVNSCEVCGSRELEPVLDLGKHPMCDDLVPVGDGRICREFPISILYCRNCRTAHQRFQVPKAELFPRSYHYRSRFTADVLNGMRALVERCEQLFGLVAGKRVLDIGCNDGSLLDFFAERGAVCTGVEPTDACADAAVKGHATYQAFVTPEVARKVAAEQGQPDFITFTNVFAHIENLPSIIESLQILMSPTTVLVVENHYLGAVLERKQFDTFYHEHPRTYSLTSFAHIAKSLGGSLHEIEFPSRYGGNIRVFIGGEHRPAERTDAASQVLAREAVFGDAFATLRRQVDAWQEQKRAEINDLVAKHGPLRAKAFPGRAAILVKLLGLESDVIRCVHEKPGSMKIGHYLPGTRIPIVSDEELFAHQELSLPLVNFAWHIGPEIRHYLTEHGYTGPVVDILDPTAL